MIVGTGIYCKQPSPFLTIGSVPRLYKHFVVTGDPDAPTVNGTSTVVEHVFSIITAVISVNNGM